MDDSTFFEYLDRKKNGEDYTSIREDMETRGFSEQQISAAIREIDAEILNNLENRSGAQNKRAFEIVGWGIIIASFVAFMILFMNGVRGGLIIVAMLAAMFSGVAILSRGKLQRGSKIHNKKWRR